MGGKSSRTVVAGRTEQMAAGGVTPYSNLGTLGMGMGMNPMLQTPMMSSAFPQMMPQTMPGTMQTMPLSPGPLPQMGMLPQNNFPMMQQTPMMPMSSFPTMGTDWQTSNAFMQQQMPQQQQQYMPQMPTSIPTQPVQITVQPSYEQAYTMSHPCSVASTPRPCSMEYANYSYTPGTWPQQQRKIKVHNLPPMPLQTTTTPQRMS
jgi:hypothetical protein